MSCLDRFLISGDWAEMCPQTFQVALLKPTSDHCPVVLDLRVDSWGPKPFLFELMCLEGKKFRDLIRTWWAEMNVQAWAGFRLAN